MPNQLGAWVIRAAVAKQRLRGSVRLRAFFELTPRAGRIAPRADVLRCNPLNVPGVDRLMSFGECDVTDCTRSDFDSRDVRDVAF